MNGTTMRLPKFSVYSTTKALYLRLWYREHITTTTLSNDNREQPKAEGKTKYFALDGFFVPIVTQQILLCSERHINGPDTVES